MFSSTKRRVTVVVAVLAAFGAATAAYAYWTAGGSGTGSAATGTTTALTAVQTTPITGMYPGDTAQVVEGNFTNPNSGPAYVSTVTVSIASVTKAAGAVAGTCDATDYTLANAVVTVGAEVPAGTAKGTWGGTGKATIKFNNKASAQDQCKGATVNLAFAVA